MVESGSFDVFILLGPTPKDVVRQYTSLTGVTRMPQVIYKMFINSFQIICFVLFLRYGLWVTIKTVTLTGLRRRSKKW